MPRTVGGGRAAAPSPPGPPPPERPALSRRTGTLGVADPAVLTAPLRTGPPVGSASRARSGSVSAPVGIEPAPARAPRRGPSGPAGTLHECPARLPEAARVRTPRPQRRVESGRALLDQRLSRPGSTARRTIRSVPLRWWKRAERAWSHRSAPDPVPAGTPDSMRPSRRPAPDRLSPCPAPSIAKPSPNAPAGARSCAGTGRGPGGEVRGCGVARTGRTGGTRARPARRRPRPCGSRRLRGPDPRPVRPFEN